MDSTIIIAVVFFVGAFIFLHTYFFRFNQTREQFLEEMEKILGGKVRPIEDVPNSHKVDFTYEGVKFTYEDLEVEGFSSKYFKANLKAYTETRYHFALKQKSLKRNMRGDNMFLTHSQKNVKRPLTPKAIHLPSFLDRFEAISNHNEMSKELMKDDKFSSMLKKYRNEDSRGNQSQALRVLEGVIVLEFQPSENYNPNIFTLRRQVSLMENYVEDLFYCVKTINKMAVTYNMC
ncbi:MAG: hypothetical protein K8S27_10965 [Candidatus Omnitrophica bacterium]|nr:hypothetical protein [Candidatus Omnitrophota bacterium]